VTAFARAFSANSDAIMAGPRATRSTFFEKVSRPQRIIIIATHGLTANESDRLYGIHEPALLLSPPVQGVRGDELLTAGKIESMEMDAELIILSACNTAAAQEEGGEALSGLARAFFEAGARGVMVSNWFIDAGKTREFLSDFSDRLKDSLNESLSKTLQRTMIARLNAGSNPRDWALFTYIGR